MNTMQFEFDAVVAHLYKQGRPAKDESGNCAYRGKSGAMCAVGCRIPDTRYEHSMEGDSASSLAGTYDDLPEELYAYTDMFQDLQYAHDNYDNVDENGYFDKHTLEHKLRIIATKYNLTFTVPETK